MGSMSALKKIYSASLPDSIKCTKAVMNYKDGGASQVFTFTCLKGGKEFTHEITVPAQADLNIALEEAAKGIDTKGPAK